MATVVIPSVEMRGILAGLEAGCTGSSGSSSSSGGACTGRLCNLSLRLWTNDLQPTRDLAWGDLVEASFPGYAAKTPVTWNLPYTDVLGVSQIFGGCYQFSGAGGGAEQVNYGWALTREDGGTVLVALSRFDEPQSGGLVGQAVIAEPYFRLVFPD